MRPKPEVARSVLAKRVRAAADRAGAVIWDQQVRVWPQPPAEKPEAFAYLNQCIAQLRQAGDVLDPPVLGLTMTPTDFRLTLIGVPASFAGVIGWGLTLSGWTMVLTVVAWTLAASALSTVGVRPLSRRVPRRLDGPVPDLADTTMRMKTEIAVLLRQLQPEFGPERTNAQAPLIAAREWLDRIALPERRPTR